MKNTALGGKTSLRNVNKVGGGVCSCFIYSTVINSFIHSLVNLPAGWRPFPWLHLTAVGFRSEPSPTLHARLMPTMQKIYLEFTSRTMTRNKWILPDLRVSLDTTQRGPSSLQSPLTAITSLPSARYKNTPHTRGLPRSIHTSHPCTGKAMAGAVCEHLVRPAALVHVEGEG